MALAPTDEEEELIEDWDSAFVAEPDEQGVFEDWGAATARDLTDNEKRDIASTIVRDSQDSGLGSNLYLQDPEYQAATTALKEKLQATPVLEQMASMIPFVETESEKEIKRLQAVQEEAQRRAGGVVMSDLEVSKNPLDWVSSLTSEPSAEAQARTGLGNLSKIDRSESLRGVFQPEELQALTRDAAAENWDYNPKGWSVRSNGEFRFSPALVENRDKFAEALKEANIPQERADAALTLLDQHAQEKRAGLVELAKTTSTFQNFAKRPENQGKTNEQIFSAFENSKSWTDWVASNVVSIPGQSAQYVATQLAGAAFAAAALTDSKGDSTLANAGRALNEWSSSFTPYDVRYSNVMGQTVAQVVPQAAVQTALSTALKRFGAAGDAVSKAYTALSSGVQIGAENYRTVFEANKDKFGVDAAHEMAMEAFKKSVPLGVSELLSLEVLLAKAPKGKAWAVAKNVASALSEVGTEQFQMAVSNTINKGASAEYVEPQTMGLGESLEMAAGTSLVELAVGGLQRRARNQAEQRLKQESEKMRETARKAAESGAPETAKVLSEKADKIDATAPIKAQDLESQILEDLEGDEAGDTETGAQGDRAATGVISQEQPVDKPADAPAAGTSAPAPTLRESVVATGIAEDAADAYIEDLRAQGISDEQILEIADNTRALREEAVRKNEAEAEARREVARRARAGDPEARAQLERERGINVTPVAEPATPPATPAPTPEPAAETQFVDLGGPPPQFQGGTNQLAGPQETPALLAPEPTSTQQPTTPEGGDTTNEEEMQRRTETLNTAPQPQPPIPGAEGQGDGATPPPAETPAPAPVEQGVRAAGAKGVISKKRLPVLEQETGRDEEGRPITKVVPAFVNDPNTLAESLHQNGGAERIYVTEEVEGVPATKPPVDTEFVNDPAALAEKLKNNAGEGRIYIPDEVIDNEEIDEANIGFAFERETGRAYVTSAKSPQYLTSSDRQSIAEYLAENPESTEQQAIADLGLGQPIMADGKLEEGGDPDLLLPDRKVGVAYEKETGRAYVTWARHSRYPDSPIMENGRTEGNETLEQLYQADPQRQANSEAQTQGEGVGLSELDQDFIQELDNAELSDLEQNDPEAVARELAKIDSMAANLASETVTTNDGSVASIGPTLADMIAQAAKNLYIGRLRGIVSGDFADAAGAVRDVKAKAVRALKSRGGENVGVSLDQQIGDGKNTVGDVTAASQALQDEEQSQQGAAQEAEPAATTTSTEPQAVDEAMQYATDMAVMELSDKDRKIWLEYKNRMTSKRSGGRGQYITKEQKRVADQVAAKARENLVEMLAVEQDVGDDSGSLKPPVLTEQERQQKKDLEARLKQALENKIRRNTERMLDLAKVAPGEKASVRTVLEALSKDKAESPLVRFFANWLLKSGHNFSEVKVHLIANRDKRTRWAGRYKPGMRASSGTIQINTAATHKGSIGQTFLHEALHHIVLYKLRPSYKRNAVEKAAYRDLMKVLTYARRQVLMPEPGETLGQVANREFGGDDTFYGLTNIDELFTETLTNERFFAWLNSQQAIPGLQTKGFFRNLWQQVRSLFQNLFSGINVRQNSLLSQALDNIMALGQDAQSNAKITEYNRTATERSRRRQVESGQARVRAEDQGPSLLSDVADLLPIDTPGEGELVNTPKDNLNPRLVERAVLAAGEAFRKIFGKTVTAVDGRQVVIQRKGEGLLDTLRHISMDNKTGVYNMQKVRAVPAIERTLKEATVRLRDADNGTLHYVRRIGKNEWHTVVVRPDGSLDDQTVTSRLATQFTLGRQDGLFRLPVDQEEKGLALWRVNTPLDQSGDPEPSPQNKDSTTGQDVQVGNSPTDASTPPPVASIPASRAQRNRMIKNAGGWKASGWFGQGLMDMRVFDRMAQKDAEVRGANFRVNETARRFNRLVKKHNPNAQVLQDALGTTANKLTDAQFDQWNKMKKAAQRETDPTKRQAALAAADSYRIGEVQKNNAQFRATRMAALNQLPPELRSTVEEMRRHIDGLSRQMIAKGMVGSNLQATLGDNLEVYLNRSYEIFDNPEWADFVKEDQSPEAAMIRNDAQRILRSQLVAEEARRIRRNARLNNQTVPTRQQALAAAQATVTPNDVSILMEEYLRVGDDAAVAFLGGRLPGKKDTSILKLRGQIPAEIRALWGEYKDPGVNYAKTYIKMANFIANHNFQTDFLDMGLNQGTPFLWKDGVSQGQRPAHWVELYPGLKDSPNPNPMAGVYGPPIIVEAFKDINQSFKHSLFNDWVAGLTGMAMASKTVYNPPQTYVRNILGNGLIMFSQGYLFRDINKLGFLSRMVESGKTVGPTMVGLRPERAPQVVDYVERLISLGVMGDNVKANVIKNLTSVIFDRDPQKAFNSTLATAFDFAKSGNERLTDAYQAGDDFWKILAFESERATFAEAYPNASPEALDRMAADRVRDVVPTYSKIPKIVQDVVKKQPYTAPFISWTSEIMRTFLNTARYGWKDATSGNPVLVKSGISRLFALTLSQGALGAVAYIVRELSGLSDEDEERLRRFLPEWQVNALIMLTGRREAGKISFWDLSYLNPYDVLHEPFIAMGREAASGGDFLDIAAKGMEKFTDPWTGEQLFFGAVVDAMRGVTVDGRPLFEEADSTWNKNKARLDRIANSLTPGAVNLGRRMYMALTGQISAGGQSYNLSSEMLGALAGQRPGERDTLQAFQFTKLPAMQRLVDSANNLSTKAYRTRGTPDLAKIAENYRQSNDSRFKAFQEVYKDIEALEGLGVPREKIFQAMKAAKVPDQDIQQIGEGIYVRRDPSNVAIENAVGLPEFPARLKALQDAVKSYPETQSLVPSELPK
jgi:hypothetical protein